jgi:hypothetical protein
MCTEVLFRSYGAGMGCERYSYKHSAPLELNAFGFGSQPRCVCVPASVMKQLGNII